MKCYFKENHHNSTSVHHPYDSNVPFSFTLSSSSTDLSPFAFLGSTSWKARGNSAVGVSTGVELGVVGPSDS